MFHLDTIKNVGKPTSYTQTSTCAYQGVRNVRFSDVFRGIKTEDWEEKGRAYATGKYLLNVQRFI